MDWKSDYELTEDQYVAKYCHTWGTTKAAAAATYLRLRHQHMNQKNLVTWTQVAEAFKAAKLNEHEKAIA